MPRERGAASDWPRWVRCRTRRSAQTVAVLYGAAFLVVAVVAIRGIGSLQIWLEFLLVVAMFAWSLVQLRHVLRVERSMTEEVLRTIDSLPGQAIDG